MQNSNYAVQYIWGSQINSVLLITPHYSGVWTQMLNNRAIFL